MRLNTGYFTHPKTVKLFLALGTAAFWIPPRLWCWSANHRADGNLDGLTAGEIAMHVGYLGDAQAMLGALLDCGFIDPEPLRIHDWDEHNAYHVAYAEKARIAAAARWRKKKEPKKKDIRDIDIDKETSIAQAMLGASKDKKDSKEVPHNLYEQRDPSAEPADETRAAWEIASKLVRILNELTGQKFSQAGDHMELIAKRVQEVGLDYEGLKLMIDRKAREWNGTVFSKGLNPKKLFGEEFHVHYGQRETPIITDPNGKLNRKPVTVADHKRGF